MDLMTAYLQEKVHQEVSFTLKYEMHWTVMILNLKYEINISQSLLDRVISTIKSALPILTWLPQYNL